MEKRAILKFDYDAYCHGCGACHNVCASGAARMTLSEKGFYLPEIDEGKCVQCGRCEAVCPAMNRPLKQPFAQGSAWYLAAKEDADRLASSSGGVFYLLGREMIRRGGLVCGCVWNADMEAEHICTDDLSSLELMRNSKYVQSNIGNCFRQIKNALGHRPVLFCGTSCQVDALRRVTENPDNLYTCSFICGGMPAVKVWRLYKESLEKKAHSRITSVNMRSKDVNWLIPQLRLEYENGRILRQELLELNLYGTIFSMGLSIAGCCCVCKFRGEAISGDVVLSDHWGINTNLLEESENKGMSAIIIRNNKGLEIFEAIREMAHCHEGSIADISASHYVFEHNHGYTDERETFFRNMDSCGVLSAMEQCFASRPLQRRIKRRITIWMDRMGAFIPYRTMKWRKKQKRGT